MLFFNAGACNDELDVVSSKNGDIHIWPMAVTKKTWSTSRFSSSLETRVTSSLLATATNSNTTAQRWSIHIEIAGFYAHMLDHDYVTKDVFNTRMTRLSFDPNMSSTAFGRSDELPHLSLLLLCWKPLPPARRRTQAKSRLLKEASIHLFFCIANKMLLVK